MVRLQGTNLKEATDLLATSALKILPAEDLEEAAARSCKIAQIIDMAKTEKLDVNFSIPI